ncbi:MAG: hypothetical protein ACO3JL_17260 [Myxococcota bacterium]
MQNRRRLAVVLPPFFLLALVISVTPAARGAQKRNDDVDPLGLAAVLLEGGHADRAERVLGEIDEADPSLDRPRLYTLRGLAALKQQRFSRAAQDLELATKLHEKPDPVLFVYLARARFGAGDSAGTLAALDAAGARATEDPQLVYLRAESLVSTHNDEAALEQLRSGSERFPQATYLREREVRLLLGHGLFSEAADRVLPLLEVASQEQALRVLAELRRAGATSLGRKAAELLRLRFAADPEVLAAVGHFEAEGGRDFAAARLLEQAARFDPTWTSDAAELYRRAGHTRDAMRIGAGIIDTDKKVRQRFGLLLEQQRFEEAAALGERLDRLGLLEEDEIAYGLAFALYRCRRLDDASAQLRRVDAPALFRTRTELEQAIAACRQETARCY